MSISGVSASYWSAFNRVGSSQQRASETSINSDIAQISVSAAVSISPEARAASALAANNTKREMAVGSQSDLSTLSLSADKSQQDIDTQADNTAANTNNWTTDTTITTPDGKVIKSQWIEVNKMLDANLSSEDKKALGFPFSTNDPNVSSSLTLLALTIKEQRELGYLKGPLTKDYLFGSGDNKLDMYNSPNFNSASLKSALDMIAQRIDQSIST